MGHKCGAIDNEHKSVMITTNLVFSEWQKIFKDPMTTLDVS
jgi:hypothetical protein